VPSSLPAIRRQCTGRGAPAHSSRPNKHSTHTHQDKRPLAQKEKRQRGAPEPLTRGCHGEGRNGPMFARPALARCKSKLLPSHSPF
jgi:hypothetical protein